MSSHAPLTSDQLAELEALAVGSSDERRVLTSTAFADIPRAEARWLWEDRIPRGAITLLVGDPGLGKSLLTCQLAAKVSRGEIGGGPRNVLMLTAEDAADVQIRPRLEVAGADLDLVHHIAARTGDMPEGVLLPNDVVDLMREVQVTGAALLVIDPLMAHLPESINSWSDQSVRLALAPLYRLAVETDCAILIVGHLNKAKGSNPLQRAGGSIGITAAARSCLVLVRDPDDPDGERGEQRVLAHFKSNYGKPAASLSYEVTTREIGSSFAPTLQENGESAHDAAALLSAPIGEERSALDEAKEFLVEELRNGIRPVAELFPAARAAGISETTLKRAKNVLEVGSRKEEGTTKGGWLWHLPDELRAAVQGDQGQEGHPEYLR